MSSTRTSLPWPVPHLRVRDGMPVDPEAMNDAARDLLDLPGAVGEHMLSKTIKTSITRVDNYGETIAQDIFWNSDPILSPFYLQTLASANAEHPQVSGWQTVKKWAIDTREIADISAIASVQLSSYNHDAYYPQAECALALDGEVAEDFAEGGPDTSAEDRAMTTSQSVRAWSPNPFGAWSEVPPGPHVLELKIRVRRSQGTWAVSPLLSWGTNVFANALYR